MRIITTARKVTDSVILAWIEGGIWANVNKTSGLQLNSLLYRFHPAVVWSQTFPKRDEILSGTL